LVDRKVRRRLLLEGDGSIVGKGTLGWKTKKSKHLFLMSDLLIITTQKSNQK